MKYFIFFLLSFSALADNIVSIDNVGNSNQANISQQSDQKSFALSIQGNGATVNVQQTIPNIPNTGGLSINCIPTCPGNGQYSYIQIQ